MPPSSQLPPLDAILLPETEQTDRGMWWRGFGLVVLVVLLGGIGVGGLIYLAVSPSQKSAFKHETLEEKQQQLRANYSPQSQANHPERRNIERFLARLVTASSKPDQRQFRQLVDFDALHRRTLQHPDMPKLNYLQKVMLKKQLEQEEGLGQMQRMRLVSLVDVDATHVIAYTVGEGQYGQEDAWRLWLAKRGSNWLLVDWELVDYGYSTSDRVALFQAAANDPLYGKYQQSEAHVQQSQRFRNDQKFPEAAAQLRLAAECPMPPQIADLQRYLIMFQWREMHDDAELIQICLQGDRSLRSPGFQLQLATTYSNLQQYEEALAAALLYETAAGFHPQVVKLRARALEELGREADALVALEQLQKLTPTDATLIPDLYRLLPAERKGEWLKFIAQTAKPVDLAIAQAESILRTDDDQATAQKLVEFVKTQAPDSPELLHIRAVLLENEAEYEQAAALFRQAAEKSTDDGQKQNRWWRYVYAMQSAGKTLQVLRDHPEPDRAFEMLASGFDDDEGMITTRELRPLVAAQLARNPEDRNAQYIAGELAQRAGDFTTAKQHLEKVAARPAASEDDEGDEDYRRSQAQVLLNQIALVEGRAAQVMQESQDKPATYQQLAGAALREKDWQALQQLNAAVVNTPTAQQNAWFLYYEAKLALVEKKPERAVQQMLLAKVLTGDGPKNPGKYYLEHLEAEILSETYGLLEAYNKHPNQRNAFSRYHHQALTQHDWSTAAALCVTHRQGHADDPQLLLAEVQTALQQGKYGEVIRLLTPLPEASRVGGRWQASQIRDALVDSYIHSQRFDEFEQLAASSKGTDAAKVQLLRHLHRGDAVAVQKLLTERKRAQPFLLSSVFATHPTEAAKFRNDPRLAKVFREQGVPLRDELSGTSLVLLSVEPEPWKLEKLREQLAATIPGVVIGEPREHACGVSYPVQIFGGEECQYQLTIGNSPYTTAELVSDEVVLPHRLRPLVAAQRSWLALESSSTEPPAAMDHPWQLLRRLAAALCDEQVLAVGFREPEAYETVFVLRDAETATVLQSPKPLSIALIRQPSSSLPFAPRRAEEQSPELKKQLRQLARQWRGGSSRPATEIRVAIDRGHRREHAWFRVASVEHAQYTGEQFLADLIPTDATADFLSEGRYQIYSNAIQEIRLGK